MELDLLSSRINLNHICLKLQVSIEDIKTKHPNRTDLLTSMEQSLHEIKKAMVVYGTLEKEFRATKQINFDLQHINLELKQEVKDLKKIIEYNNADL
jgi:protein subunit release factor B